MKGLSINELFAKSANLLKNLKLFEMDFTSKKVLIRILKMIIFENLHFTTKVLKYLVSALKEKVYKRKSLRKRVN